MKGRSGAAVVLFAVALSASAEDAVQTALKPLIGASKSTVVARFGSPQVDAVVRLVYFHPPTVEWRPLRLPTPEGRSAAAGISPGAALPEILADGCELEFRFDDDDRVDSVQHRGPGCFEFVHLHR